MAPNIETVFIDSGNDWNGIEYQRHHFARFFAAAGYRVYYIERTPQRGIQHLSDVGQWLSGRHKGTTTQPKPVPAGIRVLSPKLLPPTRYARPVNRALIARQLISLGDLERFADKSLYITYVPTYNSLDIATLIDPGLLVYINVHNYEEKPVVSDLLIAEIELARQCDYLFSDSSFLQRRLADLSGRDDVLRSPPGVDFAAFRSAYRGDEAQRRRTVYSFGSIGPSMDLRLYRELASMGYEVSFIGTVARASEGSLPPEAKLVPPVPSCELPALLRDADMLLLSYKPGALADAILPAKFYECLATGKPLLVSGLPETKSYAGVVYDVKSSSATAQQVIAALGDTETKTRVQRRWEIARSADWSQRFADLVAHLGIRDHLDRMSTSRPAT